MRVALFRTTEVTHCGSSVHYRVLAHDPSLCVVKDDELDWLVDPSVAETELNTFIRPGD